MRRQSGVGAGAADAQSRVLSKAVPGYNEVGQHESHVAKGIENAPSALLVNLSFC